VTDDPRPHELAQRQQVAWQLNIQYTLGWLVGGLATFFIARSLGGRPLPFSSSSPAQNMCGWFARRATRANDSW
jgi:hypothetical protein